MIRMKTKRLSRLIVVLTGSVLLGLTTTANAGVIYRWHTLSTTPHVKPVSGLIGITDTSWLSGSLDYQYAWEDWKTNGDGDPNSPIVHAELTLRTLMDDKRKYTIDIDPVIGTPPWSILDTTLAFDHHSGLLTGNVYILSGAETEARMASNEDGTVWTISYLSSDWAALFGLKCYSDPDRCSGATGYWTIDPSTLPVSVRVPGPSSLVLLGFGLFLLGAAFRRCA